MKWMKRFGMRVLSLGVVLSLAGCGGGEGGAAAGTSGASSTGESGKTKLAFVTNASADFWSYSHAAAKQFEKDHPDVQVIFKAGDGTPAKQKQIVDDLISTGVKGIAISPIDPVAQTKMINEWAEKIKVICCDSDAPQANRVCYLGTDNVEGGRRVGTLVKEALAGAEGPQKIMVFVGIKEVANAQERFRGLKESIEGTDIEIIDLLTDDVDFAKARKNAENTLTAHPDVAALVGLWEYNPPQILNALKSADKLGKIKTVGFDENFATLRAIDEGTCQGTVCQNPYVFGYDSLKILRDIIVEGKDEAAVVAEMKAKHGGPEDDPKLIFVDTRVIRKGQGLAYLNECQARLDSVK
jgi:ribose transport system substrate-binding protein